LKACGDRTEKRCQARKWRPDERIVAIPGKDYDTAIAAAPEFGGRLVSQCEHGGLVAHAYIADPDGYVVEIQYGGTDLPATRDL
jgi:catechol 2,3-dioxygenase-like lactoylglutathione lyase family enzyme